MLSMKNIGKIFRSDLIETHALRDFTLQVNEGDFVAVTGPSGSGKTTFLNIAGLLESFEHGEYLYMLYSGNGYGRDGLGLARLRLDASTV